MIFKNKQQRMAVMAKLRGRGAISLPNIYGICSTKKGMKKLTKRDTVYRGSGGTCKVKLWNTDIASIDTDKGVVTLDSGGYQTLTTKDRMNRVLEDAGYSVFQKDFRWYVKTPDGKTLKYNDGMEIKDDKFKAEISQDKSPVAPIKRGYHKTDGWRGYDVPDNSIAGASDTGTWADSPCPSDEVDKALSDLRSDLSKAGIKTEMDSTSTSNAFCAKRWVKLKDPRDYRRAMEIVREHEKKTRYIHDAKR